MPRTLSPVTALSRALEHALQTGCPLVPDGRAGGATRPSTEEDLEVFAMFAQPAGVQAAQAGRTHSYVVVLWCGALNCWLVYFDGEYGYQLRTHEADVLAFMRDLRSHVLVLPPLAREAYRCRR